MANGQQTYDQDNRGRIYPHAQPQKSVPEFGLDAPVLQSRTFNLGVAQNNLEVEVGGSALWCLNCSSRAAYIDVRINDQLRDPIRIQEGFFVKGLRFSRLFVTFPAQAGQTLTIYYVVDEEGRFDVKNPALRYTEIDLTKATVLETIADVTCGNAAQTLILAANANRRSAIIGALAANTGIIRIGDNGVTATRGAELNIGESITIESTEAIYVYNNSGAAQDVSVVWTED